MCRTYAICSCFTNGKGLCLRVGFVDGIQPTHLLWGQCDLYHTVEPGTGLEPATSSLQNWRSTIELSGLEMITPARCNQ